MSPGILLESRADDIALGPPNAPVRLVSYVEYHSNPFSQRWGKSIADLAAANPTGLQIILRDFPMAYHKGAALNARAAHGVFAAGDPQAFLRWLPLVINLSQESDPEILVGLALRAGVPNATSLRAGLAEGAWAAGPSMSAADVATAHINGSPSTWVNGRLLGGANGPRDALALVDEELGLWAAQKAKSGRVFMSERTAAAAAAPLSAPVSTPSDSSSARGSVEATGARIGQVRLGMSRAELSKLGTLEETEMRSAGWYMLRITAPADAYDVRIVDGRVVTVRYEWTTQKRTLAVNGKRVGPTATFEDAVLALACKEGELMIGGRSANCPGGGTIAVGSGGTRNAYYRVDAPQK